MARLGVVAPLSFHLSEPCELLLLRPKVEGEKYVGESLPAWLKGGFLAAHGWGLHLERDSSGVVNPRP